MNFFEKELRTMFEHNDIIRNPVFAGRCLIGKLSDDIRVKLRFVTTGVSDHYTAIHASIINKNEGLVDEETFMFVDIIGKQNGHSGTRIPHIWTLNDTTEWYKDITQTERAKIADTILGYVEMYQSPDMRMDGPSM